MIIRGKTTTVTKRNFKVPLVDLTKADVKRKKNNGLPKVDIKS